MKKLIILAIVFCASLSYGWDLTWDAIPNADGVVVYYKELSDATYQQMDVGNVTACTLDTMGLTQGVRYEFYLQAYSGDPRSYSGESDHIRWTYPSDPIVIEMLGRPVQITINP
jgi:hypothetical protein